MTINITSVPDGMETLFNTFDGRYLDGTPTKVGTYSIKISLSTYVDSEKTKLIGTTEKTYTLKVNPEGSTPQEEVTVSFDNNGGSGTMADVTVNKGSNYTLPDCTFTAPTGKEFKAWEVNGDSKAVGDSITVNADTTVKAIWKAKTVTPVEKVKVTFDNNGGSGSMTDATVDKGSSYKLPVCTFIAPADKEFKAWEVGGVEKAVGDNITVNANTTIKALWKDKPVTPTEKVTITFNANGQGTAPEAITLNKGETATAPTNPTDVDFEFGGWYTEAECTNEFDFSQAVNDNITLYAKWTEKVVPPTPPATTYTLTARVDGVHGTVDPTTKTVDENTDVTLTFTANTGYEIDTVTVNGTPTTVSGNTFTLTMDRDKTVVVKYKAIAPTPPQTPEQFTITFDKNGGTGTMSDVTKNKDEQYTLPACAFTPPSGKEFKAWQVDGTEKNVGYNIVVNGDKNIKAVWKDIGSVHPTPPVPPTPDKPITPTPTPNQYPYPWIVYPGWYYNFEAPKPKEKKKVTSMEIDWKLELMIGVSTIDRDINGVDSKIKMDVAPYIRDGRTMLPIRYVAEALGFDVEWIEKTRTVLLRDSSTRVEIPVETNKIIVNGTVYTSDVKPEIKNNRTMLPIANIARALGLKDGKDIIWNSKSKMVTIYRSIIVK